jgi:hypothetical protein
MFQTGKHRPVHNPSESVATLLQSGVAVPKKTKAANIAPAKALVRFRKICLSFPEAIEKTSHGSPTWFAGKGKVFATWDDHHHHADRLAVWLPQPLGAQEAFIDMAPHRFFRPPYVGVNGWVGVVLDATSDWQELAHLVRVAFIQVATAKLRARVPDL